MTSATMAVSVSSIRPDTECRSMRPPFTRMKAPSSRAAPASKRTSPVAATSSSATDDTMDVSASMYKCWPSPTSANDFSFLPVRTSSRPTPRLTTAVLASSATPQSARATGCGCSRASPDL